MAYGVLYEFRRTSSNGADMLITISQKDYTGAVKKRALGRAPVIKRENNDHIYGTSCELYAECLVDGEFSHLYTSDAYEFKVEVYKNNILLWAGFVSPELYSEPDIAPPYDVQIIATDGLGELKNYNFKKRGVASILDHLDTLMANTGLGMDFYVVSGLRYINADGTASEEKDILSVKLDLDHEEGNSCYEVLQGLLSSLNANITQHNGRYLIFRETDFISKASATGVEAFSESGSKINLPIAGFGSMKSNQWWPVGQLSTVIEPAKNHLTLKSPNHYKENVLSFDNWSLSGLASYSETDNAYVLPGADSAITQTVNFGDHEVGYRLGLRIRARNVGTPGDEEQNIGIKVEVNGRSYSVGKTFWLVKSVNTSGRPINDYLFRNTEGYIEEDLPTPTEDATSSDAQDIDIVVPLHASGNRSYVYAKNVKLTIFNPTGLYDIHVYDVSLVKYEQIKGYEANVIIENMARESESDIDLTITAGDLAPAAGDVFMTGLPMRSSDSEVITKWQIGLGQAQDYLAAMAFDYSRAISLPRMKYSGTLNVPGSATILPTLFLRDGTYYFPRTYSYDLYADEITIDLISISAADVSLSSVQISQTSEAAGTMGTTTGGPAGGGSPSAKSLAQLDDVRISNPAVGDIFAFGGKEWENMSFQKVVNEYLPLLKTLGDWFYKTDDGLSIGTKFNLFSEQELSGKGLSIGSGGSGGGLISQVYGTTAFGTIAAESNSATFNAYAIDSLYKRIVSLEGKATAVSFVPALTSGKQIGTLSIDGVSTALYAPAGYAWSEVSGKPTLIESEGVAVDGSPKVNRFGLWQGKGAYWSIGHDSNYVIQAYATANGVYLRSLTGGTDSGWKRILREGDAYSKTDADNTFLKLWGGTISVSGYYGLRLKSTGQDAAALAFENKDSVSGYLMYAGGSDWKVTAANWGATYNLLHSNNYSQYALPLTGGTIKNGDNGTPLVIDTTHTEIGVPFRINNINKGWVGHTASIGTYLYDYTSSKFIGVKTDGTPVYYDGSHRTLIHSGNVGEYKAGDSDKLGGVSEAEYARYSTNIYTTYHRYIGYGTTTGGFPQNGGAVVAGLANYSMLLHGRNGVFRFNTMENGSLTGWKTIAFTDSNVASATKLATARTIWGQSFDGTGNITGTLYLPNNVGIYAFASDNSNSFHVASLGSDDIMRYGYASKVSHIRGNSVHLLYGSSHTTGFILNSSGNVTIGTSDLAGTSAKLYVNGKIAGATFVETEEYGIGNASHGLSSGLKGLALLALKGNIFMPLGNVGIGTYSPQHKLEVTGDIASSGSLRMGLNSAYGAYLQTNEEGWTGIYSANKGNWQASNMYLMPDGDVRFAHAARVIGKNTNGDTGLFVEGTQYSMWFGIGSGNVNRGIFDINNNGWWIYRGSDTLTRISGGIETSTGSFTGAVTMSSTLSVDSSLNVGTVINVGSNIMPKTTETSYLGSTSLRFLAVCAKIGDFSGKVTANYVSVSYDGLRFSDNASYALFMDSSNKVNLSGYYGINLNGAVTMSSTLHVVGVSTFESYLNIQAGIRPNANDARYVGTSSYRFNEGYINNMHTNAMYVGKGTTYGFKSDGSINATLINATNDIITSARLYAPQLFLGRSAEGIYLTSNSISWHNSSNAWASSLMGFTSTSIIAHQSITANSGVKVASGQALTFLDASGKEHKLTYDSTAGAFKFDGNILVLGDGQFNAIN